MDYDLPIRIQRDYTVCCSLVVVNGMCRTCVLKSRDQPCMTVSYRPIGIDGIGPACVRVAMYRLYEEVDYCSL